MATKIEAARALVYSAARHADSGAKDVAGFSSMAKLFASDIAMDVTIEAIQLFGGYGYMKDYPVEKMMRDAKITQIYEGTNEVQRLVIARELLRGKLF
jgi:butyryl-CoA dehydrogenase